MTAAQRATFSVARCFLSVVCGIYFELAITYKKNNIMKRIIAIAFIALFAANLYAQETQRNNVIEVTVRVNKEVTPDEIHINITIDEKENKGKISVAAQEKEMVRVLQEIGIDTKEALTVSDMGSSIKGNTIKKNNVFVSKNYTLKVSTATQAADAIEALNNAGIARTSIGKLSISDSLEREVKNQLLTEAAQKAQENARILAEAVGSKAGKAVYIQNYYSFDSAANGRIMMKSYAVDTAAGSSNSGNVELEVSKQNLTINVTCKFELEGM